MLVFVIGFTEVMAFYASSYIGHGRWQVNVLQSVLFLVGIGLSGYSLFKVDKNELAPVRNNIILRHTMAKEVRKYLDNQGFIEVETPVLYKSTPKEPATMWFLPEYIPASFMPCLSRHRLLSSC